MVELELGTQAGRAAGSEIERLLPAAVPARRRALAVIDGVLAGRAWCDDAARPDWAVVVETAGGTVYGGGAVTRSVLTSVLDGVETGYGDLVFGFSGPDDPLRVALPGEPYAFGEAVDFEDRAASPDESGAEPLPEDVRVAPMDVAMLRRTQWVEYTLHAFGSVERFFELGAGYGVLVGDELVSECVAGPRSRGALEMGVITSERHRGRGYATLAARAVARACEDRGDEVWWNASAGNAPSLALARRLGFRRERRYELCAFRAPLGRTA
jgi:RimJ/RimL family protein N-acetyltransferase